MSTISANDYAYEALRLMDRSCLDGLQVLDGKRLFGIIYRHDIERFPESILQSVDVREYCRKSGVST